MDSSIRWTYLKPVEIVTELGKKGTIVSRNIVRSLLKKHNYVKRKAQKNITMDEHPDRNTQFEKHRQHSARLSIGRKSCDQYGHQNGIIGRYLKINKIGKLFRMPILTMTFIFIDVSLTEQRHHAKLQVANQHDV